MAKSRTNLFSPAYFSTSVMETTISFYNVTLFLVRWIYTILSFDDPLIFCLVSSMSVNLRRSSNCVCWVSKRSVIKYTEGLYQRPTDKGRPTQWEQNTASCVSQWVNVSGHGVLGSPFKSQGSSVCRVSISNWFISKYESNRCLNYIHSSR